MAGQNHLFDASFQPIRTLQVELGEPLPDFEASVTETGEPYSQATMLVRLHGHPLGVLNLPLNGQPLHAEDYAVSVWAEFKTAINAHLTENNLPPVMELTINGLSKSECLCLTQRQAALEHASFVSVIIPTRERVDQLERCLLSFRDLKYPQYEILVVDNQPATTATLDLVERLKEQLPQLRYLREDRRGVSAARNLGIAKAKGDMLAFMDDDAVVDPFWLVELMRGFEAGDHTGCVTGLVVPIELETPAQLLFERYNGFNRGYKCRIFDLKENKLDNPFYPYSIGHCGTGASMAFKREVAELIGGQDPVLGAGSLALAGGDIDSFFQVIMKGYQLVYTPDAIAFHEHRRSYAALRRQIYNYGVGLTAFFTKNLLTDLRRIPGFLLRIPRGIYTLLASKSSMNAKRGEDYPFDLKLAEWNGMLRGPFAYFRSLRYVRGENQRLPARPLTPAAEMSQGDG